jgi:hypothetical protein
MSPEPGPDQGSGFACDVYGIREIPVMTDSTPPTAPTARGHFSARINGTPFITTDLSGMSCLRPELTGARSQRIWKIHAVGKVGPIARRSACSSIRHWLQGFTTWCGTND